MERGLKEDPGGGGDGAGDCRRSSGVLGGRHGCRPAAPDSSRRGGSGKTGIGLQWGERARGEPGGTG